MAERKVLNKYFPPDFDPSKVPKRKASRTETKQMKVRTMLPMSVRCLTCGNYMGKGSKFNVRMEDVKGEDYLGIKIFRFYYKCKNCAAEFCMKTDPKTADYIVEAGATRNYEAGKEEEAAAEKARKERDGEEKGDAMKALENRMLQSKRELDMANALDEMKTLRSRHEDVGIEAALQRVRQQDGDKERKATLEDYLDEDDEMQVQMMLLEQQRARMIEDDDSDGNSSGGDDMAPGLNMKTNATQLGNQTQRTQQMIHNTKQNSLAKRIKRVDVRQIVQRRDREGSEDDKGSGDEPAGVSLFGEYGDSE
jgi:hypothetical protein